MEGDKTILSGEQYIEALASKEFKREVREYIDSRIEFQVQECFDKLFKAKIEDIRYYFCKVCGEHIKNGSEFCKAHEGQEGMLQAIRNWKFIITKYPQLGLAIINTMKKEGEM